jgi:hypothetical protein
MKEVLEGMAMTQQRHRRDRRFRTVLGATAAAMLALLAGGSALWSVASHELGQATSPPPPPTQTLGAPGILKNPWREHYWADEACKRLVLAEDPKWTDCIADLPPLPMSPEAIEFYEFLGLGPNDFQK